MHLSSKRYRMALTPELTIECLSQRDAALMYVQHHVEHTAASRIRSDTKASQQRASRKRGQSGGTSGTSGEASKANDFATSGSKRDLAGPSEADAALEISGADGGVQDEAEARLAKKRNTSVSKTASISGCTIC